MMILLNMYPKNGQKSFRKPHAIRAAVYLRSSNQLNERGYAR